MKPLFLFIFNAFFIVSCFFPSFSTLWAAWQTDEYSHGPLIPLIAVLIGWHRLVERKPLPAPHGAGLAVLGLGFVFLAVSRLSAFEPLSHYGLVIALVGLSLLWLGRAATAALAPAFIYLLFAIPLPQLIYVALSADMQLLSSTMGVWLLQLVGIPVFQEGNIIDLGGYKLQVVEACSGLRYLFPLLSFSFLVAFLFEDRLWKRAILFLSAVPLTIILNALRIALVGVTVDQWGSQMAEGVLHDFEGWVIFSVCVLLLFAEMAVLRKIGRLQGGFRYEYLGLPRGAVFTSTLQSGKIGLVAVALSGVLAVFFLSGAIESRQEITPPHPAFATFPTRIEGWVGQEETLSSKVLSTLQLSDYWLASYEHSGEKMPVDLYVAYYASQRIGSSIHSPSNCIPGGGWRVTSRDIVPVVLTSQTISVTRMLIRKAEETLLVYYWFDGRGRIINEQYGAKWYLFVDSLTMRRTDGALVRLTTPLAVGEKEEVADARLQSFLSKAYPVIQKYIPGP